MELPREEKKGRDRGAGPTSSIEHYPRALLSASASFKKRVIFHFLASICILGPIASCRVKVRKPRDKDRGAQIREELVVCKILYLHPYHLRNQTHPRDGGIVSLLVASR